MIFGFLKEILIRLLTSIVNACNNTKMCILKKSKIDELTYSY